MPHIHTVQRLDRLAENTNLNIGILEAGQFVPPNENELVDTPGAVHSTIRTFSIISLSLTALTGESFTDPKLAWQFNTVPQANVDGRSIFFPRHVITLQCHCE